MREAPACEGRGEGRGEGAGRRAARVGDPGAPRAVGKPCAARAAPTLLSPEARLGWGSRAVAPHKSLTFIVL